MASTKSNANGLDTDQCELELLDKKIHDTRNLNDVKEGIEDQRCGWGPLSCSSVKVLKHPVVFSVTMMLVVFLQISAVGVYVSGVLSTIEKRFQLKSSESGFMTTMNDILGLAFVLPVAYVGHKLHRPRIIACGTFLVGIGTIICAVPQFVYDSTDHLKESTNNVNNQNKTLTGDLCVDFNTDRNEATQCSSEDISDAGSQLYRTTWFLIGQALCGIGQAPIWPLTITFLDDNVGKSNMPGYLALFFTSTALSPIYGYSLSAACLSLDVDFYLQGSGSGLQPGDPNYIGAWWLGFIINGLGLCFLSIVVFSFPRVLSKEPLLGGKCNMLQDQKETEKESKLEYADMVKGPKGRENPSVSILIKDFFKTIKRLFTNPAYLCVLLSLVAELSMIAGFGIFTAKYIQKQYGIPASKASIVLGSILTPAVLLGVSSCGLFLKKFNLSVRGFARLCIVATIICLILGASLLGTGCDNPQIAGLTVRYNQPTGDTQLTPHYLPNLTATCNADCSCAIGKYNPVCGGDGITYVTSCHAGCKGVINDEKREKQVLFQECSCIQGITDVTRNDIPDVLNHTQFESNRVDNASPGQCENNCDKLVLFAVMYGALVFVNSWLKNPGVMLLIRVVHEDDRTIAMGFNSVTLKILAFFPAPIYFGAAIESTCILWNESCGETGDCLLYDIVQLRYVFIGLFIGLKCLNLTAYSIIAVLGERAHKKSKHFTALPIDETYNNNNGIGKGV